nr:alpha/beta hydrolase fold protein [Tanacetum cinerariifolium]
YLLGLLANEGYLIISVPYNVTFDHSQAAREVFERFHSCLTSVLTYGLPSDGLLAAELVDLPLYSVGHSNGALLQVLSGSYFSDKLPKANAIISYNNRPATEAVPYFEQLGPLVSQMMPMVEASPVSSMAKSAADAWKALLDTAEAMAPGYDPETRVSLDKFVDQLPSVFNQVAQGISEFKPTPTENRECCKNSYNVPKTLLVKFNTDAIDETDLLEETLRARVEAIGGTLDIVSLSGNHITPCIQKSREQRPEMSLLVEKLELALELKELHDLKLQREYEAEEMRVTKYVCRFSEILLAQHAISSNTDECFTVRTEVKFNTDAIDETDLLEETLRARVEAIGGILDIVSLSGNHITPCIQ